MHTGSREDLDEVLSRKVSVGVKALRGLGVCSRVRESHYVLCEVCVQRSCMYSYKRVLANTDRREAGNVHPSPL